MEDFNYALTKESKPTSALLSEWLEDSASNITNRTDIYLSFANIASDKQEPGKDNTKTTEAGQAEKLDKELKDFAAKSLEDPSHSMQRFQKAVDKFCSTADKETAMDELSDTWSSINTRMKIGNEALYYDRKEEIARQPGRKELEALHKQKEDVFFRKLINLPYEESRRIEDLMKWQDGETKAEHRDRIRKGLANNKSMLSAYNEMEAAEDNIEASKSAREKELDKLLRQIKTESNVMLDIVEKAYVRSSLK